MEIHDVKFKGAEIREFNGRKDLMLIISCSPLNMNEDGYFSVDLFLLKMVMTYDRI